MRLNARTNEQPRAARSIRVVMQITQEGAARVLNLAGLQIHCVPAASPAYPNSGRRPPIRMPPPVPLEAYGPRNHDLIQLPCGQQMP